MTRGIDGLIAATLTPFDSNGNLNTDVLGTMADFLVEQGVNGFFVCGTTGEGLSLTLPERKTMAEAMLAATNGRAAVIVHAGHACLRDACELAEHAAAIGADAVATLPPFYHRPGTVDLLIDSLAEVADAAGDLPLYYYHIPCMSGVSFDMIDLLRKAKTRVPTLAGVKFTYENLMDFRDCLAFDNGRYNMLFGRDEMLLAGVSMGARGAVGSTYNILQKPYLRIFEALERGDMAAAQAEQMHAVNLVRVMKEHGGTRTLKVIMAMRGVDCGSMRLPQATVLADEAKVIRAKLDEAGFFGQL